MFIVQETDVGARIDVAVTRHTGFSRSHVAAAMRTGAVSVNGAPAKPSRILETGDRVEYAIDAPPELTVVAQDIPLDIVFEDETLIVVNNRPGW